MLPPGKKRDANTARGNTASLATTMSTGARVTRLISEFLKTHCTVTRSDLDGRDLIYGRGAEGKHFTGAWIGPA